MKRVYGDKEMFWLSLSIIGDENYQFNSHPAAAIGQLTTYQERVKHLKTHRHPLNHKKYVPIILLI